MKIGNTKVVVKPAMFVLIGSIVIAAAAIPMAAYFSSTRTPTYGLVNPHGWTFESRGGAQATVKTYGSPQKKDPQPAAAQLVDSDAGFKVNISHPGWAADHVYVRNGLNLDQVSSDNLTLTFEAIALKPFPAIVTIGDLETDSATSPVPVWHQLFTLAGADWKSYSATIPVGDLRKSHHMNLVIAIQLGEGAGEVSFRNIYLRQ